MQSDRSRHVPVPKHRGIYYSERKAGKVYEVRYDGRYETVGTLAQARARLAEIQHRKTTGTVIGNFTATLNDVIDDWSKIRNVKPRTQVIQDANVRLFIRPTLGRMKVRDITRGTIIKWLAGLKRKDGRDGTLDDGSKALILATLSSVLDLAVDDELIAGNPVRTLGKRKPRQRKIEARVLRDGELEALLDGAGNRRAWLEPIVLVTLYAALRLGEVCGLEWADVDFETNTLRIARQVGQTGRIGTPKGGKPATIPMVPELCRLLAEHKLASGKSSGAVFRNERGDRRLSKDIDRAFRAARVNAGISIEPRPLRFHDLRHTTITRIANTPGAVLPQVQEFARHASLNTTLGYIHQQDDAERVERFASALNFG